MTAPTTLAAASTAPTLLTRKEVAAMLRVSEATLSRWAAASIGPRCIWLAPAHPRYDHSEILRFMKEGA